MRRPADVPTMGDTIRRTWPGLVVYLGILVGTVVIAALLTGCAHLGPALTRIEETREQAQRAAVELTRLVAWCDDQPAPQPEVCAPARRALDELAKLEPYLAPVGLEVPAEGGE